MGDTQRESGQMSQVEHAAWWASLNDDEQMLAYVPSGYYLTLLWAAYLKHALINWNLPVGERLAMLQALADAADQRLTHAVLAVVEPAGPALVEIFEAAMKLDDDNAICEVLTRWSSIQSLVRLEPSLLDAIRLMERHSTALGQGCE
jgi:hypothetical protein